jgi:hypothetical protein
MPQRNQAQSEQAAREMKNYNPGNWLIKKKVMPNAAEAFRVQHDRRRGRDASAPLGRTAFQFLG